MFLFTAMSFTTNDSIDKITTEIDCVVLAADVQAAMESHGSDT